MYTFTGTPTTLLTITHKMDYTQEDMDFIASEFSFVDRIRTQGRYIPQAGGGTNLWLVLEFIGQQAASGIIGGLAMDLFTKIATALINIHKCRSNQYPILDFDSISLVYDDLTIRLTGINPDLYDKLPQLISDIHEVIAAPKEPIHNVIIPIVFDDRHIGELNLNRGGRIPHDVLR